MPRPTLNLAAFLAATVASNQLRRMTLPRFARRRVLLSAGTTCPLCLHPYDRTTPREFGAPVVAPLVHPMLGGPLSPDNAFACCRRCQQQRGANDVFTNEPLPQALQSQRAEILLSSHNHLLPLATTTRSADFLKALARRHTLPRARLFAAQGENGGGYLGVSSRFGEGPSQGLARLLARQIGTLVHDADALTVYHLEDDSFRALIWNLIDTNAFVVALARRQEPRDFRDCWWLTSPSPSLLRRRLVGIAVPQHGAVDHLRGVCSSSNPKHNRWERRQLNLALRATERTLDGLRQAVNNQHKAHWLDGQIVSAACDARLLDQLADTEAVADNLRSRLANVRRHSVYHSAT